MARQQSLTPRWQELAIAMSITEPGSAKYNRTGDWRSSRPLWNLDACIKCGVCTVFCPEGCIAMRADGFPEADMEYCKGCGICVAECWTGCIRMEEEAD
ncbi:MAG TPA: 4Fe-4S binding protein [Polyangia bacterium]|nr:4Fe-4S binding protein [Polyangia bacterium]